MNIKLYTAAREATSKARNVASAIQQAQRQVNDDNKDIKDKVDKNQQNRAKNKAKEELEAAKVAKDLAAKQLSISQQQATAGAIQALGAVAAAVIGAQVDKKKKEKDDPKPPIKDDGKTKQTIENTGGPQDNGEKAKGGGILGKIKDAIKSVFGGGKDGGGAGGGPVGDGGGDGGGGGKGGGPGLGDKLKKLGSEFLDMGDSDTKYAGVEGKGNKNIAQGTEGVLKGAQMVANPMMAVNKLAGMADQGLRGIESKMGLGAFAEKDANGKMVKTDAGEAFANIMDTVGKLLGAKEIDSKLAQIANTLKEIGGMFDDPSKLGILGKAVKAGLVDTFKATTQLAGAALTDLGNAATQAAQSGVNAAAGRNGDDNGAVEQTKENETNRANSLIDNAGSQITAPVTPPTEDDRDDGSNPSTTPTQIKVLTPEDEQKLDRSLRQLYSAGTEEGGRARSQQEIDDLVNQGIGRARQNTLGSQLGIDKDLIQVNNENGEISINGAKLDNGIAQRLLSGDVSAINEVKKSLGLGRGGPSDPAQLISLDPTKAAENATKVIGNGGTVVSALTEGDNPVARALQGITQNEDGSGTKQVNGTDVAISKEDLAAFKALQAAGANVAIGDNGKLTLNGNVLDADQAEQLLGLQRLGVNISNSNAVQVENGKITGVKLGINGDGASLSGPDLQNVLAVANSSELKGPVKLLGDGGIQLANGATIDKTSLDLIAEGLKTADPTKNGAAKALLNVAQSGNGLSISNAKIGSNGDLSVNGITVGANAVQVLAGNTSRSGQDITGSTVNRDVSEADKQLLVEAVRAGSFLATASKDSGKDGGIKVDLGGLNSDNSRVSLTAGGKSVSQSDLRALSSGNASLGTYQDILGDNTSAAGAVRGLLQSLGASDIKIGSGTGDNFTASDSGDKIKFSLNGRESTIQLNEIDLGTTDGGTARQLANNQAFGAIRAVAQLANNGLDLSATNGAPNVTINRQGTVNINEGGRPQRTLDSTSISRINGDTSGGVASNVATSIATGGQIEGNRSAGSFSNTRQALDNFKDVFGRIGSGVSGVFGPGKGNDSKDIPESLKEGAIRKIDNAIDKAKNRGEAVDALKKLGFTQEQIDKIIPENSKEAKGFTFSKDSLVVSRSTLENGSTLFSVGVAGVNGDLGGLEIGANGVITPGQGALDFSGLAKNANNNRRDVIAENLNNFLADKGFGRSVVFADQIQLDAQGNLAGVRIDGKNLSVEQFAAQAFANRSGNAKIGSAGELANELRTRAGVALQRSSGALQNGGGGSDLANSATTLLNNLKASGFDVSKATIDFKGEQAVINIPGKAPIVLGKGAIDPNDSAGLESTVRDVFDPGKPAGSEEQQKFDNSLANFNRNQQDIERLTKAIETGFQAKAFGLFGVTNSKVNNLQVSFDENTGRINAARATLANGSEVAFNRIDFDKGVFSIDKSASKGSETLGDPENTYLNSASERTLKALRQGNAQGALDEVLGTGVVRDQKGYSGNNLQVDKNDYNNSTQERDYTGLNVAGRDIRLRSDYDVTGRGTTSTSDLSQAERALLSNQILSQQDKQGLITTNTEDRVKGLLSSLQNSAAFKQAVGSNDAARMQSILDQELAKQGLKAGSVTAADLTISGTGTNFSVKEKKGTDPSEESALSKAVKTQVTQDVAELETRATEINKKATTLGEELVDAIANDDELKNALANGDTSGAKVRLEKLLEDKGLSKDTVRLRDITTTNPNTDKLELKSSAGITAAALGSGALNSRQLGIQTALLAQAQVDYDRTKNGGTTPEGVGSASAGVAQLERNLLGQLNSRLGGGEQPVVQRGDQLTAERNVVESIRAAFIARGGQLADFNLKFATTQVQDLLNDETFRAQATSLDPTQRAAAEAKLKQANRNAGLADNAIELKDLGINSLTEARTKGIGTLFTAEEAKEKLGSVNVTAGYDGRDARIDVKGITFQNANGGDQKADFSITRNQRGGYSINLDADAGFGKEIKDQLGKRFSSDEGKEGMVSKVTKALATGLNAAMPGIEYWRKGMEAIQEALIQLEAAKKQLAAALDYFAKMGLTPGMIVAGGDGAAAAPAGGSVIPGAGGPAPGGPAPGGGNVPGGGGQVGGGGSGGGTAPGTVDGGGGGDSSGGNGPGPVGEGDGTVDGTDMDANGDGIVSEAEEIVGNSASSSAFDNLAVNLGYMPGMLIQMAQDQGRLEELSELMVSLSQPDKINPIVAMIQFTQKLMSDPNQLADAGAAALGG
jgi:hypothetical protein